MLPPPFCSRQVPTKAPQLAENSPEWAPARPPATTPAMRLSCCPALPDRSMPIRTCPPPVSCWSLPRAGRSGTSDPMLDCRDGPIFYRSSWRASRLRHSLAARTTHRAGAPHHAPDSATGKDRLRVHALCHFRDHPLGPGDILQALPRPCLFVEVFRRAPPAASLPLGPHVLWFQPWVGSRQTYSGSILGSHPHGQQSARVGRRLRKSSMFSLDWEKPCPHRSNCRQNPARAQPITNVRRLSRFYYCVCVRSINLIA